jgi:hypothetical protein
MNCRRVILIVAALALAFAIPMSARTDAQAKDKALADVIVNFGDPANLAGAANQVVLPDDVTIRKGGTVTFVVNGGGHGLGIYPVSKDTTRDEITAQLCPHDAVTNECTDSAFANGDHTIHDGKENVIIVTGANPPFARIDDPTNRLFATSIQIGNVPSAFLTGSTSTTVGTFLQYRFTATGRFLVMCVNRNHGLSNWMFGFVNVGSEGDDQP